MSDTGAIAVTGVACRFPGARDAAGYWENLRAGREGITRFGTAELLAAGVSPDLVRRPEYVPARGVLPGGDRFDWAYFGYSRADAARIDPQQRVFLECAATALDDAGLDPRRFDGWIGVFGGVDSTGARPDDGSDLLGQVVGRDKDYVTTRVAYKLGLRGPAVTVQSACSTSLVAVHLACQSLLTYESDAALAGGAALWLPQARGYLHQEGHILSTDGSCRPFDAAASGTVTSSGAGVVVLKRLEDALRNGDRVLAVIRGTAVNNDGGEKVGFTTPAFAGQRDVIQMAMAQARVDPADIRHVETHGTGTRVGDPVEVAALAAAFGAGLPDASCWLGAAKSNLGHTGVASGIAGLIKTAWMLSERELVPTLHYRAPNPELHLEQTPFRVCTEGGPWVGEGPLLASVSSFGIGGTNAHAVLEAPPQDTRPAPHTAPRLFALSAATAPKLARLREETARRMESPAAPRTDDAARTLATGRREHPHRLAVRATTPGELAGALRSTAPSHEVRAPVRPVFLFPGQGALRPGAGAAAYALLPRFRAVFDETAGLAGTRFGIDLTALLDPSTDPAWTRDTRHQQLGLFALGFALSEQFRAWGAEPEAMLGHSLGEYTAAACAGVWELPDALALVHERGSVMSRTPAGAMLAVTAPRAELARLTGSARSGLSWAVDSTDHGVVSAAPEAIGELERTLREQGFSVRRLDTAHAFHSPLMEPAAEGLRRAVAATAASPAAYPVVSNLTGGWTGPDDLGSPDHWADQMLGTVRLTEGFGTLLAGGGRVFAELGPGASLARGVRRHERWDDEGVAVPLLGGSPDDERATLLAALGALWQHGVPVPLDEITAEPAARVCALPPRPFEPSTPPPPASARSRTAERPAATPPPAPLTHESWVRTTAAERGEHDLILVTGEPSAPAAADLDDLVRALGRTGAVVLPAPGDPVPPLDTTLPAAVAGAVAEHAAGSPLLVIRCAAPADEAFTDRLDAALSGAPVALAVIAPAAAGFPDRGATGPLAAWALRRRRTDPAHPVHLLDPGTGPAPLLPPALTSGPLLHAWRHGQWWSLTTAPLPEPPDPDAARPDRPLVAVLATDGTGAARAADLAAAGVRVGAFATTAPAPARPAAHDLAATLPWNAEGPRLSQRPDLNARLDAYGEALIDRFVTGRTGLEPGTRRAAADLRHRLDPSDRLPGVTDFLLRTLVRAGRLREDGGHYTVAGAAQDRPQPSEHAAHLSEVPGLRLMLEEVADAFPDVFDGRREPVSVLWPDGEETRLRERLHANDLAVYDASPALDAMAAALRALATGRTTPLRVLEAGGGHGSFTWRLLRDPGDAKLIDYHFTDVSPLLVRKARAQAASLGLTSLRFSTFDITRDPVDQGLAAGTYDLVVGYNVVHVAPQVRAALRGLHRLLAGDGLLALVELTRVPLWNDLLNSLAPGWWDFDDDLRHDSIHLDTPAWTRALAETGFTGTATLPGTGDADHALLLAAPASPGPAAAAPSPATGPSPVTGPERAAADLRRQLSGHHADADADADAVVVLAGPAPSEETARIPEALRAHGPDVTAAPGARRWTVSEEPPPGAGWRTEHARARLDPATDAGPERRHHLRLSDPGASSLRWLPLLIGRPGLPAVVHVEPEPEVSAPLPLGDGDDTPGAAVRRHPDTGRSGSPAEPAAGTDDPVREALAELWCEVLGLPRADPADEFFALGGESLMAVHLLSRIRDRLGARVPVPDFVTGADGATFGALLETVRAAVPSRPAPAPAGAGAATAPGRGAAPAPAGLMPFRTTGTRTPVFFVAPAAGSSLCYRELAGLLDDDQPFYGLDSPGLEEDERPLHRFEELAAHHIAAIRRVRPDGPYVLGGWSIGAMVAHEMVRQLRRDDVEVELLLLVDGLLPHTGGRPVGTRPAHLTRNLWYHLQASLGTVGGTGLGKTIALTPRPGSEDGTRRRTRTGRRGGRGDGPAFARVHNAAIRAMLRYRPRPVECPAVLLKTGMTAAGRGWLRSRLEPLYPGGLRVEPAPGDHWTLFSSAHVATLAAAVGDELARTRSARS